MMKMLLVTVVAVLAMLCTSTPVYGGSHRKVCYYTNWAQYRPGMGKFTPENIKPGLCTHLMYAFATLVVNSTTGTIQIKAFEWNDESTPWSKGMYQRFEDVKSRDPGVKTLLAVGGWNLGSRLFHQLVRSSSSRKDFAQTTIKFLRTRGFDGVDIDWEYPANRGSPPEDKHNFSELLQALRDAIEMEAMTSGKPKLLLTAAVAAGKKTIDTAYEIPTICRLLDFISIMTYDLHGSWEGHTGHNSPLYSRHGETGDDKYLNTDWALRYWVSNGCPKHKMNGGLAMYGRSFTLTDSTNTGIGAPARGPGQAGRYTRERGFLSYQEICQMKQSGGQVKYLPEHRVHYCVLGDQWVGYDDIPSIQHKVCYMKQNGYGGIMIWSLDLDDFSGSACNSGPYPLLQAASDEVDNPNTAHCIGPGQPLQPVQIPTTKLFNLFPWNTPKPVVVTTPQPVYTQPKQPISTNAFSTHGIHQSNKFDCYGKPSGFYNNPTNCEAYYICANSLTFEVNCARGLQYNPKTKYCDLPQNVMCTPTHPNPTRPHVQPATQPPYRPVTLPPYRPVTLPPYRPPTSQQVQTRTQKTVWTPIKFQSTRPKIIYPTNPVVPVKNTKGCVNKPNGLFRDSLDCTKYFNCYFQLTFVMDCPKHLVYNERIKACDYVSNVPECAMHG